ncbi:MAG: hypothetical protein Q4C87_01690 [Actinomycetaceae bacterium]|nr:hypothetical protein [Actinomycetaceae bacterium]
MATAHVDAKRDTLALLDQHVAPENIQPRPRRYVAIAASVALIPALLAACTPNQPQSAAQSTAQSGTVSQSGPGASVANTPISGAQPATPPAPGTLAPIAPVEIPALSAAPPATGPFSFTDPAHGTTIHRATQAGDGQGGRLRHEYSRRQAFNADNSRLLAQDGAGNWYLTDPTSGKTVTPLKDLAGDCEPLWHPTNPNLLRFTSRDGGPIWWELDVATGTKTELFNLTGKTPWPQATQFWTKGEGTTSADGRILTLMATHYDQGAQQTTAHGVLTIDVTTGQILGTLSAADFPVKGAMPDHVSTSPSGKYAVVSWLDGMGGTRAFTTDFAANQELTPGSEHSDLAQTADGRDVLVTADYGSGMIAMIDLADGRRTDLHTLYPAEGEAYAVHFSGQNSARPGWVVVSTYADTAEHGQKAPSSNLRAEYRKVWLLELTANPRALGVAHVRAQKAANESEEYFLEPQASASRDLSKVVFASNLGGKGIESWVVDIPIDALNSQ